jgi:hypothetical protein
MWGMSAADGLACGGMSLWNPWSGFAGRDRIPQSGAGEGFFQEGHTGVEDLIRSDEFATAITVASLCASMPIYLMSRLI